MVEELRITIDNSKLNHRNRINPMGPLFTNDIYYNWNIDSLLVKQEIYFEEASYNPTFHTNGRFQKVWWDPNVTFCRISYLTPLHLLSVWSLVRPSGKITFGPNGPFLLSRRLQPFAGARKKPPVERLNFLVKNYIWKWGYQWNNDILSKFYFGTLYEFLILISNY